MVVLTNHPQPNKLITVHWPSIETRAWHSNKEEDIYRVHQILKKYYENSILGMYYGYELTTTLRTIYASQPVRVRVHLNR